MIRLSEDEELEYIYLLEQAELERVSPKMERFREPWRIKIARGGRGAGAKSRGFISLLVQEAQRKKLRIACLREVQNSLAESVYQLIRDEVARLRYTGWKFTQEYIDSPTGSHIIFRGLKDMNAANQIKSLAEFDLFFIEEAATVSMYSWETLLPTLRKPGSELWAAYNPITVSDPITVKLWNAGRDDALLIEMEQGRIDNPWWTDELQKEMEEAYKQDPDEAEHIWGGKPRAQGHRSVLSRRDVSEAMERTLTEKGGKESLGIDVARFGGDLSVIVHRRGNQVLSIKEFSKVDTQEIARIAWDMINRNPSIPINTDDTGVGGGVSDKLKDLGALVNMVHFGGSPIDRTRYTSCADEMWFTLPIQEMVIPPNQKLLEELTTRQFSYTQDDRKKIESKDVFKKRLGRSPDTADALVLAFYEAKTSLHLSHADREAMRLRNAG